jgi:hypothetical protein
MSRFEHERHADALGLHPRVEMLECVLGFLDVVGDVHQVRVDDVSAQILPECIAEFVVVLRKHRLQRLELHPPP